MELVEEISIGGGQASDVGIDQVERKPSVRYDLIEVRHEIALRHGGQLAEPILIDGRHSSAFDNDRSTWAVVRAEIYRLRGDSSMMRSYADTARAASEAELAAVPGDGQRHAFLGLMLAYLGRNEDAIREGERAAALVPLSRDAYFGAYIQHQLARIYVAVGDQDKALDRVELLLKTPYYLSPGWLRIDPTFAPLRSNPRFQRLVSGS